MAKTIMPPNIILLLTQASDSILSSTKQNDERLLLFVLIPYKVHHHPVNLFPQIQMYILYIIKKRNSHKKMKI